VFFWLGVPDLSDIDKLHYSTVRILILAGALCICGQLAYILSVYTKKSLVAWLYWDPARGGELTTLNRPEVGPKRLVPVALAPYDLCLWCSSRFDAQIMVTLGMVAE